MAECLASGASRTAGADPAAGPTLSVIIPAFNEQDGIAGILERILATEEQLKRIGIAGLEVIVVDDGSGDATAETAAQIPDVRLVKHVVNRGYGAAIKTGFGRASGDLLAFLDADSTYPPECLIQLCAVAVSQRADLVIGSRRSGSKSRMPLIRRIGNLIWSSLLTLIGKAKVEDPASGMRVLWRRCLQQLYPLPDGLNFTPVMSARALFERLSVVELPIPYAERSGRSKLNVVRDGLRFLTAIIWTVLQYNPARILELCGSGALMFSGSIGVLFIMARLNGVTQLRTWGVLAAYSSLVLAVGGVSAFSLGIAFDRLVALFHHRPIRQTNWISGMLGFSLERHLAWIGGILMALGLGLGALSLLLALQGWEITRVWFWLLGSALFLLSGVQLGLFSLLIRVLDALNHREERIGNDLRGADLYAPAISATATAAMGGSNLLV